MPSQISSLLQCKEPRGGNHLLQVHWREKYMGAVVNPNTQNWSCLLLQTAVVHTYTMTLVIFKGHKVLSS